MQIHVAPERRFAADFKPAGDAHRPLDVGGRLQNRGQLIARGQDFDGEEVRFALLADMTRRAEWVRQILFAAGEPIMDLVPPPPSPFSRSQSLRSNLPA